MSIDFLFNSVSSVPTRVLKELYDIYGEGTAFPVFMNVCDGVAEQYGLSGDYLCQYIVDMYENN